MPPESNEPAAFAGRGLGCTNHSVNITNCRENWGARGPPKPQAPCVSAFDSVSRKFAARANSGGRGNLLRSGSNRDWTYFLSLGLQTEQVPPDLQCVHFEQFEQAVQIPVGEHLAFCGSQQSSEALDAGQENEAEARAPAQNRRRAVFMATLYVRKIRGAGQAEVRSASSPLRRTRRREPAAERTTVGCGLVRCAPSHSCVTGGSTATSITSRRPPAIRSKELNSSASVREMRSKAALSSFRLSGSRCGEVIGGRDLRSDVRFCPLMKANSDT